MQICFTGHFGQGCLHASNYTSTNVENFCIYLQAREQLHPPCFSIAIAKIWKLPIFGTLGMPGRAHPR